MSPTDAPNPSYIIKWDYDEETGEEINKIIVFPNDEMNELAEGYVMLMRDGSFYQNRIIVSGTTVILPIGLICSRPERRN